MFLLDFYYLLTFTWFKMFEVPQRHRTESKPTCLPCPQLPFLEAPLQPVSLKSPGDIPHL